MCSLLKQNWGAKLLFIIFNSPILSESQLQIGFQLHCPLSRWQMISRSLNTLFHLNWTNSSIWYLNRASYSFLLRTFFTWLTKTTKSPNFLSSWSSFLVLFAGSSSSHQPLITALQTAQFLDLLSLTYTHSEMISALTQHQLMSIWSYRHYLCVHA